MIKVACQNAQNQMGEKMPNPLITCDRYEEKYPHPEKQEAFTIKAQFPWHRMPQVRAMIEITYEEVIVLQPVERPMIHGYESDFQCSLNPLEEIIAEKLRAILQNIKKHHERGWSRSRARDYYDIWCILHKYGSNLNLGSIPNILQKKCIGKNVSYGGYEDFFNPIIIQQVKKDWNTWLAPLVPNLVSCDLVLKDLESDLKDILRFFPQVL